MQFDTSDYYTVLGVDRDSPPEAIRTAYRRMAVRWHPDKHPSATAEATEKFRYISEAYQVLSNPVLRAEYDEQISGPRRAAAAAGATSWDGKKTCLRYTTTDPLFSFEAPRDLFNRFFRGATEQEKLNNFLASMGYSTADGAVNVKVRARHTAADGSWSEWTNWERFDSRITPAGYIVGADGTAASVGDPLKLPAIGSQFDNRAQYPETKGQGYRYKMQLMDEFRQKKAREEIDRHSQPPPRPLSAGQEYKQNLLEQYRQKQLTEASRTAVPALPPSAYLTEVERINGEALSHYRPF